MERKLITLEDKIAHLQAKIDKNYHSHLMTDTSDEDYDAIFSILYDMLLWYGARLGEDYHAVAEKWIHLWKSS